MTRDEAKKLLPVIQAYADGKDVQGRSRNGSWRDLGEPSFWGLNADCYRIKPEPLECWITKPVASWSAATWPTEEQAKTYVKGSACGPFTIHHMREVI